MQSRFISNSGLPDTHKFEIVLLPIASALLDFLSSPESSAADTITKEDPGQRHTHGIVN